MRWHTTPIDFRCDILIQQILLVLITLLHHLLLQMEGSGHGLFAGRHGVKLAHLGVGLLLLG